MVYLIISEQGNIRFISFNDNERFMLDFKDPVAVFLSISQSHSRRIDIDTPHSLCFKRQGCLTKEKKEIKILSTANSTFFVTAKCIN